MFYEKIGIIASIVRVGIRKRPAKKNCILASKNLGMATSGVVVNVSNLILVSAINMHSHSIPDSRRKLN